jgi:hypothetical protein
LDSEFTEFSYGFAVTHELVLQNAGSVYAAPEFPSLIREGRVGGGYDVKLDFGNFLFVQFKLSEYMEGALSGQGDVIGLPYYRFWITPTWRSQQHRMLVDLESTGQQVYYAAPIFYEQIPFNEHFQNGRVVDRSAFFSPAEVGYLTDDQWHCVVFTDRLSYGYYCSEPKRLRVHTGTSLKKFVGAGLKQLNPTPTLDLAASLRDIVRSKADRVPSLPRDSVPDALTFISFVAHVFLHSEVFFAPSP